MTGHFYFAENRSFLFCLDTIALFLEFAGYFGYSKENRLLGGSLGMFTITDIAATKAKELLKAEGKENFGLRVYTVQGGG